MHTIVPFTSCCSPDLWVVFRTLGLVPILVTSLVGGSVPNPWDAGGVTADHRLSGHQHSRDNPYPFQQSLGKLDEYLAKLFFPPAFDFWAFIFFFIMVFYYKVIIDYTVISQFLRELLTSLTLTERNLRVSNNNF